MPTQRQHGGAALVNIPLTVPGFLGLNTQSSASILGPEWATSLGNSVIDDSNRVAARKGWDNQTTGTDTGDLISQLFEYRQYDGTTELLANVPLGKIYRSTDDGDNWAEITGTSSSTSDNIQFLNFSDVVVGVTDDGEDPIQYSGTSFSDLSVANVPTGTVGLSAFGRLWITDTDNTVVQYSALLNEQDWNGSDTGAIDMRNIWPEGDNVTALAAFNGVLVIFGRNNIAIYTDGQGSELGIDPTQIYLVDTITGIGCIARDSVVNVDGDLWFLSANGVVSLGRLIQEKSNPLNNLSSNVADFLQGFVDASSVSQIRAVFSPEDRVYLLSLPQTLNDAETGRAFAFDTRGRLEDGTARCMGTWDRLVPRANVVRQNGDWLSSILNVTGRVGLYAGNLDNGVTYTFNYESSWMDLTQQGFLIIPKRVSGLFFLDSDSTVTLKWAFDFETTFQSEQVGFTDLSEGSEFSVAEFSIGEYGGGLSIRNGKVAGRGTGEYIKLAVSTIIDGGQFALQQLDLFAKIGRFA